MYVCVCICISARAHIHTHTHTLSHRYFHELDGETKTCRISRPFLVGAVCTLLLLTMTEVALSEIYQKLAKKLTATYATSA